MSEFDLEKEINELLDTSLQTMQEMKKTQEEEAKIAKMSADYKAKKAEMISQLRAKIEARDQEIAETKATTVEQEAIKANLNEQLKILGALNRDYKPQKKDPYWLTDNCNTISNIELTMPHDKMGNVKGWMEGEPTSDNWDGLTDNQLMILEDKEPERRAKYHSEL